MAACGRFGRRGSAHLCVAEVHLGMLLHKLLEHFLLLLLLTRRLPLSLHLLVVHHLLDHAPRLTVKITELAVLRYDLGCVDLGS